MGKLFLQVLNMSIAASWLVLAVVLLRLALKKAPKWARLLLWGLVAVRLIFPFTLESAFSLIPSSTAIDTSRYSARPYIQSGISAIDQPVNDYLGLSLFRGRDRPPRQHLSSGRYFGSCLAGRNGRNAALRGGELLASA